MPGSVRRRAYKATTNSNQSHPIAPNLLMRNFSFERPDQAWVGDITYIPTGEGWLYLQYPMRAAARNDVFVYLEAFYNTVRPHSALG